MCVSLTHRVKRVVAAAAELVATLRAAEVHAASFGKRILEATVWTCCSGRRVNQRVNPIQPPTFFTSAVRKTPLSDQLMSILKSNQMIYFANLFHK